MCLMHAANKDDCQIYDCYVQFVMDRLMNEDCYILDPVQILRQAGRRDIDKVEKAYRPDIAAKVTIGYFVNGPYGHFVLCNNDGEVIFDPLGSSNSVKNGTVQSYRLFY